MKTILMGAAALSLIAAPAFAQDTSVTFTGNVAAKCDVPQINETVPVNLALDADGYLNGGNKDFTTVFDLGALLNGVEAWCNTATTVEVTGTSLVNAAAGGVNGIYGLSNGFTATIPMRIADLSIGGTNGVSWSGEELNTGAGLDGVGGNPASSDKTSNGAFAGPVSGLVQIWNADKRPVAGAYSAQWTVTVAPN